jgi:predicted deacylase
VGLINNILNRYFGLYFPRAVAMAEAMRTLGLQERLVYTTHPWLVDLYLHCANYTLAGVTLQCPSQPEKDAFTAALRRGDIAMHAAAFNMQWENALTAEMVDACFEQGRRLAGEGEMGK